MTSKPTLQQHPNACPGGYVLDLYCKYDNPKHGWDEFPWGVVEFQTYGQAARYARRRGWILHKDGTGTCPKCARALKLKAPNDRP